LAHVELRLGLRRHREVALRLERRTVERVRSMGRLERCLCVRVFAHAYTLREEVLQAYRLESLLEEMSTGEPLRPHGEHERSRALRLESQCLRLDWPNRADALFLVDRVVQIRGHCSLVRGLFLLVDRLVHLARVDSPRRDDVRFDPLLRDRRRSLYGVSTVLVDDVAETVGVEVDDHSRTFTAHSPPAHPPFGPSGVHVPICIRCPRESPSRAVCRVHMSSIVRIPSFVTFVSFGARPRSSRAVTHRTIPTAYVTSIPTAQFELP